MKHREKLLDWFTRRSTITPMQRIGTAGLRSSIAPGVNATGGMSCD